MNSCHRIKVFTNAQNYGVWRARWIRGRSRERQITRTPLVSKSKYKTLLSLGTFANRMLSSAWIGFLVVAAQGQLLMRINALVM